MKHNDAERIERTEAFLEAVRRGEIETRGAIKKEWEKDYQLFLNELTEAFGEQTLPAFKSLATAWARLSASRAAQDQTLRAARQAAALLKSHWDLAKAAGFPESVLCVSLHRLDVAEYLRAAERLDADVRRMKETESEFGETDEETSVSHLLEKNRGTILVKALKLNDPGYASRVLEELPSIVAGWKELVSQMNASGDPLVLEASGLLSGNLASFVNYAISSGRLKKCLHDVERKFGNGAIVREIESEIRRLGKDSEAGRKLVSNKASIVSRSIHHGTLDFRMKAKKCLDQTVSQSQSRVQSLLNENRRLRSIVADLMLARG